MGLEFFVEPGKLREYLEVAQILRAEDPPPALRIAARSLPGVVQLAISRIAIDHTAGGGLEKVAQHELLLGFVQALGWLDGAIKKRIARFAGSIFLNLYNHGWHQVESLMDVREFLQNLDHAVIIFERMETSPGQTVFTGRQILVEGLVLVPHETQMDALHEF